MRLKLFLASALCAAVAAAETTFDGRLSVATTWRHAKTAGASQLAETLPTLYTWTHASGTNEWQMDALVGVSATLAAGATNTLSLGACVNGFGDRVSFRRVSFLAVRASVSNAADIVVGGSPSDPFWAWSAASASTVSVRPGGFAMFAAPTNGFAVGTATNLMIRNASAASAAYDLYIGGAGQ